MHVSADCLLDALRPLEQVTVTESADGRVTRIGTADLAAGQTPARHHWSRLISISLVFLMPSLLCGRPGITPQSISEQKSRS